jgi:PAS domain S-box-containing protein
MIPAKPGRPESAPALFRLLSDSALSRCALDACGAPLVLLNALLKSRPVCYINHAFEAFFGVREAEALGHSLAALLFRGDEALVQRMLTETSRRWELTAHGKGGDLRHVEVALGAVRGVDGKLTHWVLTFADRGETERLRAEVESLKGLAAGSLGLRLDAGREPARGAQQPGVKVPAADELNSERKSGGILHQR